MLQIDQLTDEIIFERYSSLPDNLADALDSAANVEAVKKVCLDYHLVDAEKVLMVQQLAAFTILGFLHPDDLASEINTDLELENPKLAASLVADIKTRVFAPIKDDIGANYFPVTADSPKDKNSPMILAAIGETSAPPVLPKVSPLAPAPPPTATRNVPPPPSTIIALSSAPTVPPPPVKIPVVPGAATDKPSALPASSGWGGPTSPNQMRADLKLSASQEVGGPSSAKTPGLTPLSPSPRPNPVFSASPLPKVPQAPELPAPKINPPLVPASPKNDAPPPLPMMMHETLAAKPIGRGPDLRMDFSKQTVASGMSAPRPQGVAPRAAQLELGPTPPKTDSAGKDLPPVAKVLPRAPRVVNYSSMRADTTPQAQSPFAQTSDISPSFRSAEPINKPPSVPPPPDTTASVPFYKPLSGAPATPQAPEIKPTFTTPPAPPSKEADPVRHEGFIDLTHLDKKPGV